MLRARSFAIVSLCKLRKLFRRDSTAHMHPRKRDDELITVQRMEKILRERNIDAVSFHLKVSSKCAIIVVTSLAFMLERLLASSENSILCTIRLLLV